MITLRVYGLSLKELLCGILLLACEDVEDPPQPGNPTSVSAAAIDDISDHFIIAGSTKIDGEIPLPASGANLEIDVKDTLYLMEAVLNPISIRHTKETDVAGVYLQVMIVGLKASYYYDVPELVTSSVSDTVSVIQIQFDPEEIELPLAFDVVISPYNESKEVMDEGVRTFKVEADVTSPCWITSDEGDSIDWVWYYGYRLNPAGDVAAIGAPNTPIYNVTTVGGCCDNGLSTECALGQTPNAYLDIAEYYLIGYEFFEFRDDRTFTRETSETSSYINTDPGVTDFCSGFPAYYLSFKVVRYAGTWTFDPATKELQINTTFASDMGYGNSGGVIRYTCHLLEMKRIVEGSTHVNVYVRNYELRWFILRG